MDSKILLVDDEKDIADISHERGLYGKKIFEIVAGKLNVSAQKNY